MDSRFRGYDDRDDRSARATIAHALCVEAWTRNFGEGRVFYTGLGHELAVWQDPRFQQMLLNGIKWAMGR